jgi:hypothetical protein
MPLMAVDALSDYGALGDVLILVDAARCAGDPGVPLLTVANSGTLQMSDSPTEGPATMVSLFQSDSSALKLERYFSFIRPFADSVAVVDHASYATGSP